MHCDFLGLCPNQHTVLLPKRVCVEGGAEGWAVGLLLKSGSVDLFFPPSLDLKSYYFHLLWFPVG